MGLREQLQEEIKTAMKARAAARLSALRLIAGAIKDREIALRSEGGGGGAELTEADILPVLGKMSNSVRNRCGCIWRAGVRTWPRKSGARSR